LLLSLWSYCCSYRHSNLKRFQDKTGAVATFNTGGDINENNPFFQSLGTNGRSCATCHQAVNFQHQRDGRSQVYERTHGETRCFAAVDGATSDDMSRSRGAWLLLEQG
jgi:hypothetical protein